MLSVRGPFKYSAANAGARARLAQLLPPNLWSRLMNVSGVDDFVGLLAGTAYHSTLTAIEEPDPSPERVEKALRASLVNRLRLPLRFIRGEVETLLDWHWRRFELNNLKLALRAIAAGTPAPRIRAMLVPLGAASGLPWEALSESRSVSAAADRLPETPVGNFFRRTLKQALDRYQRESEIFVLEVALDLAYYRQLLKLQEKLFRTDREYAEKFIGTRVESKNLLWAFRGRIFFDLSPEEILNYTLQRRLRVDASVVRKIATGASLPQIVEQLWGRRLIDPAELTNLPPAQALRRLELAFQRYLYRLAHQARRGYPFHLGIILAYQTLLESETQDLITVLEGNIAGWSTPDIQDQLIGKRG